MFSSVRFGDRGIDRQFRPGQPDNLYPADDTERRHYNCDDQDRPGRVGAENTIAAAITARLAMASLREQIHTDRIFASPSRKRQSMIATPTLAANAAKPTAPIIQGRGEAPTEYGERALRAAPVRVTSFSRQSAVSRRLPLGSSAVRD